MRENLKITTGIISVILALFHFSYISGIVAMSTMTLRVVHITLMMILAFIGFIYQSEEAAPKIVLFSVMGCILSGLTGGYILLRWETIVTSGGLTTALDGYMGSIMILTLIVITYKMIGKSLAIIVALFSIYPFIGQYLFGVFRIRTYSFERIFTFLYSTTQGIFGIPLGVAASYIIFFCIFGAFLGTFGVGDFMFKLSQKATNGLVASTAKTAIAFSTFMGMISGTAAGNVAVTGSLTIPMMNKSGYKRHESAAVEAVASTGGQIMPPIMGAAAFIMAEMTSTEYSVIMKSAIIPAILFFSSIYIIVHLISLRDNIDTGVNRNDEDANILSLIKSDGYLLFPIITLILFMVTGYSPLKSALYSIGIMLILHLIVKREFSKTFLVKVYNAIVDGAKSTMLISIACGVSGIIVGVISITGVGSKLSSIIIDASGGNLFIALLLTMVTSIILGMGLPTTAAYLIPVSVIAPALVQMGVPLLTAHMFIFLFACVSTITPPVALASYVAAGISEADINKVGWTGFRFATASYILPFMLVYSPAIMLSGDILSNILAVISGFVTIYCIAVSIVGYFNKKLSNAFRIAMLVIGLAIVKNNMVSNIVSLIIFTILTYSSLKNKGVKK